MKTKLLFLALAGICLLGNSCSQDDEKTEKTPKPQNTLYKIGDYYQTNGAKGIVYKVRDQGKHGMIVSLDEASLAWSTEDVVTNATNEADGLKNMEAIRQINDWAAKYPAFKWCDDHNTNGETAWFFPSHEELLELYATFNAGLQEDNESARTAFNQCLIANSGTPLTADDDYWASTEINFVVAHEICFSGDGGHYGNGKSNELRVRAVRAF